MLEVKGNVWNVFKDYDAICITTNGFVKTNGECVMGRGIALEAKQRFPIIPKILGNLIREGGNNVYHLGQINKSVAICSFPVKHHWNEKADIELMKKSSIQLIELADEVGWKKILLPRPGCGNGGLKWSDVKPIFEELFDDRFYIITF